MAQVSADAQARLVADVESIMRQYPVVRTADWRGPGARGGRDLVPTPAPQAEPPQAQTPRRPQVSAQRRSNTSGSSSASSNPTLSQPSDSYWEELTRLGGQRLASDVQAWLIRYVKDLTLDEIELLAKQDDRT